MFLVCDASASPDAGRVRRTLFKLADIASNARKQKPTTVSPIAFEALRKFDVVFMLECLIKGSWPAERVATWRRCTLGITPLLHPSSRSALNGLFLLALPRGLEPLFPP
jgi:hypothetical protein